MFLQLTRRFNWILYMLWSLMHNQERILHHIYSQTYQAFSSYKWAFATKDSKVGYIWFLPGDELIWRFLEEAVGIHSVGCMASRIDCFRPKLLGHAIIIQHSWCPLHRTILQSSYSWTRCRCHSGFSQLGSCTPFELFLQMSWDFRSFTLIA